MCCSYFSRDSFKTTIHSLVSCLDYYNSLFAGLLAPTICLFELVKNAPTHLLYWCGKFTCISYTTRLLLAPFWTVLILEFSLLLINFLLPFSHFSFFIILSQQTRPHLLFFSSHILVQRSSSCIRNRAFSVITPKLCNELPANVHSSIIISSFFH